MSKMTTRQALHLIQHNLDATFMTKLVNYIGVHPNDQTASEDVATLNNALEGVRMVVSSMRDLQPPDPIPQEPRYFIEWVDSDYCPGSTVHLAKRSHYRHNCGSVPMESDQGKAIRELFGYRHVSADYVKGPTESIFFAAVNAQLELYDMQDDSK